MSGLADFSLGRGAASTDIASTFERFGIVVLKGLLPPATLAEQRRAINRLLAIRLRSLGQDAAGEDIDGNLRRLLAIDRRHGIEIIRAVKDSPFFLGMFVDPRLQEAARACLGCDTLLAVHDIAQFRIDPPDDDERNFDWHQDFQYNVMSLHAATVWYPLTAVTQDMGPLVVAPRSHRTLVPVHVDFADHLPGSGTMHRVMRFAFDKQALEKEAVALCPVEEGDVVLFHSLLAHRSSPNRSTRARWTMNPRFGDAADPAFAARGWKAVRDKTQDAFLEFYPEHVRRS